MLYVFFIVMQQYVLCIFLFFFKYPAPTEIYTYLHTLSLHDALPISSTDPPMTTAKERLASRRSPTSPSRRGGGSVAMTVQWPSRAFTRSGDRKSTRLNSSH